MYIYTYIHIHEATVFSTAVRIVILIIVMIVIIITIIIPIVIVVVVLPAACGGRNPVCMRVVYIFDLCYIVTNIATNISFYIMNSCGGAARCMLLVLPYHTCICVYTYIHIIYI